MSIKLGACRCMSLREAAMNVSRALLIAMAFLVVSACTREEAPRPVPGNKAPQFALKDTTGTSVLLSAFSGKVVLLDFWATWCGPCKESIPEMAELHQRYAERGFVILGISMDEGTGAAERVQEYAERSGIPYRLLLDDGKVSKTYRVRTVPATFLLDQEQVIVESFPGYVPGLGGKLAERIEKLLETGGTK